MAAEAAAVGNKGHRTPGPRPLRSSTDTIETMHGRLHHVILDCPDPRELARFYSELLNHPITYASDEFVVVAVDETTSGLAFRPRP